MKPPFATTTLPKALTEYKAELRDDPIISTHLTTLYDTLLEQNLIRVIEPFSRVQVCVCVFIKTMGTTGQIPSHVGTNEAFHHIHLYRTIYCPSEQRRCHFESQVHVRLSYFRKAIRI